MSLIGSSYYINAKYNEINWESAHPEGGVGPLTLKEGYDQYDPFVSDPNIPALLTQGQSYFNPHYQTTIKKISDHLTDDPTNAGSAAWLRPFYSRRDTASLNDKWIALHTINGWYYIYDNTTNQFYKRLQQTAWGSGSFPGGNCDLQWSPTDPDVCHFLSTNGTGFKTMSRNVVTDDVSVYFDLDDLDAVNGNTGLSSVTDIIPTATGAWSKGEGSASMDHRYWGMRVVNGALSIIGWLTYDRIDNTAHVVSLNDIGLSGDDHCGMTPSGRWIVISGGEHNDPGARAYSRDFSKFIQLQNKTEHSDMFTYPNGDDGYAAINFHAGGGGLIFVNIDEASRTGYDNVVVEYRVTEPPTPPVPDPLPPAWVVDTSTYSDLSAGPYPMASTIHFSGRCFNVPGWVMMTTYNADSGRWADDKIIAIECKEGGRKLHITNGMNTFFDYVSELHGSVNRDFTQIHFASNWRGTDELETYKIELPAGTIPAYVGDYE